MSLTLDKDNARWVTGVALVLANLMPLGGVLLLGWDPGALLFVYWLESAVVGFFNVIKMAQAEGPVPRAGPDGADAGIEKGSGQLSMQGSSEASRAPAGVIQAAQQAARAPRAQSPGAPSPQPPVTSLGQALFAAARVPLILFFLVHYGLFMTVHLVFLLSFFSLPRLPVAQWLLTTLLLFTSHGISYLVYFIGRGESRSISASEQMARPYGRIAVMHLTIIFGAMVLQALHAPAVVLALLVGFKILFDLASHFRSHARYEAATPSS
jgi:hypothetical protein